MNEVSQSTCKSPNFSFILELASISITIIVFIIMPNTEERAAHFNSHDPEEGLNTIFHSSCLGKGEVWPHTQEGVSVQRITLNNLMRHLLPSM